MLFFVLASDFGKPSTYFGLFRLGQFAVTRRVVGTEVVLLHCLEQFEIDGSSTAVVDHGVSRAFTNGSAMPNTSSVPIQLLHVYEFGAVETTCNAIELDTTFVVIAEHMLLLEKNQRKFFEQGQPPFTVEQFVRSNSTKRSSRTLRLTQLSVAGNRAVHWPQQTAETSTKIPEY